MSGETVLVTGGSGFIASHCILRLLNEGCRVRATLRSLKREAEVRALLTSGGAKLDADLTFFAADLTADAGWAEAAAGCDYVLHVASPILIGYSKNEDDLIVPAREGALRVLRAARDAGVKRVVLTSSFAAIGNSQNPPGQHFTEKNWSDVDSEKNAYSKSKTIAERAAWDFMTREGGALELAVVNPVYVFGPVLGADYSPSIEVVRRLLDGALPGTPRLSFNIVDVRDVADLHLRAMRDPAAKGERFLAVTGDSMTMHQIAMLLRERLGEKASRVPSMLMPDWLMKLVALTDPAVKQMLPSLGKQKNASSEKARRLLGWAPGSREDAIVATAESLISLGLLKSS